MKTWLAIACSAFLVFSGIGQAYAQSDHKTIEVAFSPNQGATTAIVSLISEAKRSIRVAAYSFTSKEVAQALLGAHKRGVDVKVVLDKSNETASYSSATFLENQKIPLRINHRYAIMHSKYIIVDGKSVETGSYNYSSAAENKNAENVIVLRDMPDVADQYTRNWQKLWDESRPYERRLKKR